MTTQHLLGKLETSRYSKNKNILRSLINEENIFIIHNLTNNVNCDEETLLHFVSHKEKFIRLNIVNNIGATATILEKIAENEKDEMVLNDMTFHKNCSIELRKKISDKLNLLEEGLL